MSEAGHCPVCAQECEPGEIQCSRCHWELESEYILGRITPEEKVAYQERLEQARRKWREQQQWEADWRKQRRGASKIIGIDFGTTKSVVAIIQGGEPIVLINVEGSRITPSVVTFTESGEWLIGQIARRQAITNPKNTIFSIKRLIGRRFDDAEVQKAMKVLPYNITRADNNDAWVEIRGKRYSLPEISAFILQKMKQTAEDYLGEKVTDAVITVPAYFNESQRQATKDAGRIAGLTVRRIISDSAAASLAYRFDKSKYERIAVFDLGGGTFDISIFEVEDGYCEVKATNGHTFLGGDDFDHRTIDYLIDEFRKDQGVDLRKDRMALQRLKEAAEKAKIELSSSMETEINLPFITADPTDPKHLTMKLTRAKLEALCGDLLDRLEGSCLTVLNDAGLSAHQIDEVVLVGGMTHMPAVQELVRRLFGKEPNKEVNPDEVVAVGAAIQGAVMAGAVRDMLLLDATPLSLGIETVRLSTDGCTPEEVGVGDEASLLLDGLPTPMGSMQSQITQGGVFTRLIEKNTSIPIKKSQIFSTASDNQTVVMIRIFQGERELAADNKLLGQFNLVSIPPAPRGVPEIEVTFDIDADSIMHVSAKDLGTGKERSTRIIVSSGLTEEEIKRMAKDAEAHAEEDKRKRERIEARNHLDSCIYSTEKSLKDHRNEIDALTASNIKAALEKAQKAMESEDAGTIKAATDELTQASHKLAEVMYARVAKEQADTKNT